MIDVKECLLIPNMSLNANAMNEYILNTVDKCFNGKIFQESNKTSVHV